MIGFGENGFLFNIREADARIFIWSKIPAYSEIVFVIYYDSSAATVRPNKSFKWFSCLKWSFLEETNLTFYPKNLFYVPISAPNTKRTQPMTHASIAVKPVKIEENRKYKVFFLSDEDLQGKSCQWIFSKVPTNPLLWGYLWWWCWICWPGQGIWWSGASSVQGPRQEGSGTRSRTPWQTFRRGGNTWWCSETPAVAKMYIHNTILCQEKNLFLSPSLKKEKETLVDD